MAVVYNTSNINNMLQSLELLNMELTYVSTLNPGLLSTSKLALGTTVSIPVAKTLTTEATILCGLGINIAQTTTNISTNTSSFRVLLSTLTAVAPSAAVGAVVTATVRSNALSNLNTVSNHFSTVHSTANTMYNNFYLQTVNGQDLISNTTNSAVRGVYTTNLASLNVGRSNYTSSFVNLFRSLSTLTSTCTVISLN